MTTVNELERAVLGELLAGEQPALQVLRAQCARLVVSKREITGVGFFTEFRHPPHAVRLLAPRRARFGDVLGEIDGLEHGAGFVLFVDDGLITMLEGYSTASEPWPEHPARWTLRYWPPERDLGALARAGKP